MSTSLYQNAIIDGQRTQPSDPPTFHPGQALLNPSRRPTLTFTPARISLLWTPLLSSANHPQLEYGLTSSSSSESILHHSPKHSHLLALCRTLLISIVAWGWSISPDHECVSGRETVLSCMGRQGCRKSQSHSSPVFFCLDYRLSEPTSRAN